MGGLGLTVKGGPGGRRVELQCEHHNGLLYVVPSEGTWVCADDLLHAHAIAGFLHELGEMNDPRVKEAMQRWGLYYRERPLVRREAETSETPSQDPLGS